MLNFKKFCLNIEISKVTKYIKLLKLNIIYILIYSHNENIHLHKNKARLENFHN